jgi:hypothetical protein
MTSRRKYPVMSSGSESISRVWDACHRFSPGASYARSMETEPLVRVVRGRPTDRELAALVAVLIAQSRTVDEPPRRPGPSAWTMSARPTAGPRSWRASGLSQ